MNPTTQPLLGVVLLYPHNGKSFEALVSPSVQCSLIPLYLYPSISNEKTSHHVDP